MFKKIEDYGYSISEDGQVRNDKTGRILKPSPDGRGYLYVSLCKNGEIKNHKIHRMLGIYFLNCPADKVVDHIDGNTMNNSLSNLRVVTQQQNTMNNKKAKGYCWDINKQKWRATIFIKGKCIFLGNFDLEDDARKVYLSAKNIYHII